jgi:hypothetical protein
MSLRWLHQRRNITGYQVVTLGLSDRPHQHVVRNLHRPRRRPRRQGRQGLLDMRRSEIGQLDSAQFLDQRLSRLPFNLLVRATALMW